MNRLHERLAQLPDKRTGKNTRYRMEDAALGVTLLGDDLYSRQPLCETILEHVLNFILVCKPVSHKTLYEWVEGLESTGSVQTLSRQRRRGKKTETDTYRFVNQVPLRDGDDALPVNWCEFTALRELGQATRLHDAGAGD